MISCFDHFFRPASLSIKHTSFLFAQGLELASRLEDGPVESYWLAASNILVRIPIQPATYSAVLLFIKYGRAGLPLLGERQIDIIGELT